MAFHDLTTNVSHAAWNATEGVPYRCRGRTLDQAIRRVRETHHARRGVVRFTHPTKIHSLSGCRAIRRHTECAGYNSGNLLFCNG